MKRHQKIVITFIMLNLHVILALSAPTSSVCDVVAKSKEPSAYLIDKNGEISRGPLNYGRFGYVYRLRDTYTIPTDYKLIITPSRINVGSCSENCVQLKKIKPICPSSQTYAVNYIRRDSQKNEYDRKWLPMTEYADFEISYDDPSSMYPIELKFHFKPIIEGEIFDATPK